MSHLPQITSTTCSDAKTPSVILQRLLQFFDKENVGYAILGLTHNLLNNINSDIDMVISSTSRGHITKLLLKFCNDLNIYLVQVVEHDYHVFRCDLAWYDNTEQVRFLNLDLYIDLVISGRFYMSGADILQTRVLTKVMLESPDTVYTPSPARAFMIYLIKKMERQEFDVSQSDYLSQLFNQDLSGASQLLSLYCKAPFFGLLKKAAEENDWQPIREQIRVIAQHLHQQCPVPFNVRLQELTRKIRRILHPSGLWVAFLGVDGSGKSTVISTINERMAFAFRGICNYHLMPRLLYKRSVLNQNIQAPHLVKPRNLLVSVCKLGYWALDYIGGYFVKVMPQLVRTRLVIFDRYYHDVLVDPRRYRYSGPMLLAGLVGKLLPKPNKIILLDAPPEVLQTRKQEVSFDESKRQREAYVKLVNGFSQGVIIDASQSSEQVASDVTKCLILTLAERVKKTTSRLDTLEIIVQKVFPVDTVLYRDVSAVSAENQYLITHTRQGYPRWIIPRSQPLGAEFLNQWRPYGFLSSLWWWFFCRLYALGFAHYLPGVVSVGITSPSNNWSQVGWQEEGLIPIIYIGTPSALSRAVVCLTNPKTGEPKAIAKIPLGEDSAQAILAEAQLLKTLVQKKAGIAPQLLFTNPGQGISVEEPVTGAPSGRNLTQSHIDFLLQLAGNDETTSIKSQTQQVIDHLEAQSLVRDEYQKTIDQAVQFLADDTRLETVVAHGDFAPWNLKYVAKDKLAALDWERATLKGLPGYDLIHFFYIQALLFNTNREVLPQLQSHGLVQKYFKTLSVSEFLLSKLVGFYLLDAWRIRLLEGNLLPADIIVKDLERHMQRWS